MAETVKTKAESRGRGSILWQAYFMLSVAVIGALLAFGIATPFFLLSRLYRPAMRVGDAVLGFAIFILMRMQRLWVAQDVRVDVARARGRGCLLVSNHRSHLDAFLLLGHVPGIRIFARRSLFRIPFLGAMMWLSRQIPAGSSDPADLVRAMEGIADRLRQGDVVHVFPEMTRCPPGFAGTRKFLQSPFRVAYRENVPVFPVVVSGTDEAWPKGSWTVFSGVRARVVSLGALEPRDFPSEEAFAARARELIEAALARERNEAALARERNEAALARERDEAALTRTART